MKIADIQFEKQTFQFAKPVRVAFGEIGEVETLFVKIITDEGITGYGEAAPLPFVTGDDLDTVYAIGMKMRKALLGQDPVGIAGIHRTMDQMYHGNGAIKCAIDLACYDIAAKAANMPLYRFLGADCNKVHSDVTIGMDTPEQMAKEAKEWVSEGFSILKVKLGENIDLDYQRMKAIRDAVGDDVALRIDANQGWSVKDSITIIPQLETLGVGIIEQPVAEWDYEGLKEIKNRVNLPIAADESCHSPMDAAKLAGMRAVDYINIKLMKCGGIYPALKINAVAESFGIGCMIGCMGESSLANMAGMHLAAALDNIKEVDLDSVYILKNPKVTGGFTHEGGQVILPDTPGIGVEI